VSGVPFVVASSSPSRTHGGTEYFFCCGACWAYFGKHPDAVLAARGLLQGV